MRLMHIALGLSVTVLIVISRQNIPKTNCIEFFPGNGFLTSGSEEKNQKAVRFGFVVELFVLHCDISEGFISSHAEPADYFQIMLSFK